MKIAVSGASGHLGNGIMAEVLRRGAGHDVIAVSRSPEKCAAGIQARLGDYDKPAGLASAYAGVDRLVIIPSAELGRGRRGTQNVAAIDAAVAAGVDHILFVSAAGTRASEEPEVWASYYAAEQRLMRTARNWTILRVNYYAEAFVQEIQMSLGHGVITGLAENKVALVSRDDVARAAAGVLMTGGHAGAIYHATGPTSMTGAERAAAAAAATGKPFQFMVLPKEILQGGLQQAGLPPEAVGIVLSIQSGFAVGGFDVVTGDVKQLTGKKPRSVQDVLKGAFG